MTSRRLTTTIGEWVERAVDKYALGDRFTWDMTFVLTEEGPRVLMVFFLPGAVVGTQLQTVVSVDAPGQMTEPDAVEVVKSAFEQLRHGRSEQMGLAPPPNGEVITNGTQR